MNAEDSLHHSYAEWKRLAEAEGEAIRAGNWGFVAECQGALSKLPKTIDRLIGLERSESTSPALAPKKPSSARRAIVLELIELQQRNLASIQQRRQRLSAHIEQLSRTGRNLRGIQRSYAQPAPSGWSSYS